MKKLLKTKKRFLLKIAVMGLLVSGPFLITDLARGGTYTSSKHGQSADRSVLGATIPYTPKGHCGQCHEQHASIGGQEITPPPAEGPSKYLLFRSNYGANKNELCYSCHELLTLSGLPLGYGNEGIYQGKSKYLISTHNTDSKMLWSPDPSPPGPAYADQGNCNNCHNPHGYSDGQGVINSMVFSREESLCEACHDSTQAGIQKDVKTQLNKTYSHPTHSLSGRHILPETGQPSGSSFGPANRHAECADCHNPHTLGAALHAQPGNGISDVLRNVWGVEPTWPPIWTQPVTFTALKPPMYPDGSQYEYQICFKCHSYYGLGTLTGGISTIFGPSGTQITDQGWEFNPNNASGHPVVTSNNNMGGSGIPKALAAGQMSALWAMTGTQTMYCSDCHGADNEEINGAKGPHGSTVKYMLKGAGKYWPTKSDGITLWQLNPTDAQDTNLFCKNCHPINISGNWANNVHAGGPHQNQPCVACHVVIPHGYRNGRLIGYSTDPAPYNYGGNSLKPTSFTKTNPTSYTVANCTTVMGCHP